MASDEHRICAYEECGKEFCAKVYNAIYCSAECRKIVTNRNLLASYYEKKLIKIKKELVKQKIVKLFYQGIIKKPFVNLVKESAM